MEIRSIDAFSKVEGTVARPQDPAPPRPPRPQQHPGPQQHAVPQQLALIGEFCEVVMRHLLHPGVHHIGTDESSEIVLPCAGVDPLHAAIEVGPGACLQIRDFGSENGTYVNGRIVGSRHPLVIGDQVWLGPAKLRLVEVDGDELSSAPTNLLDERHVTAINQESQRFFTANVWARIVCLFTEVLSDGSNQALDALAAMAISFGVEGCFLLDLPADPDEPFVTRIATRGLSHPQEQELTAQALSLDGHDRFHTSPRVTSFWRPNARLAIALTGDYRSREVTARLLEALVGVAAQALQRRDSPPSNQPNRWRLVFPDGCVQGQSAAIRELYRQMSAIARTDLPVLLHGETGTGKEWVARTLHDSSPQAEQPFVAINCAAIPRSLLEAELFGIADGVATGVRARVGKFVEADGGTLFLDEIGDMPLDLQAKLLRVLQDQRVEPLGGPSRRVRFRLLAATHHDIFDLMDRGQFRQDLYYRIAGRTLVVPPLRQRGSDAALFIDHFIQRFADGDALPTLTVDARRRLLDHAWPGNIRELENEVRGMVAMARHGVPITSRDLSHRLRAAVCRPEEPGSSEPDGVAVSLRNEHATSPSEAPTFDLASLEARTIRQALEHTGGNKTQAARLLGISRWSLLRRLGSGAAPRGSVARQ